MKNTRSFFLGMFCFWIGCLFLSVSCSDDDDNPGNVDGTRVGKVKLDRHEMSVVVGTNDTLIAMIYPETAENKNVTWSSNRPELVSVDENGVLTALEIGTATVAVKTEDGEKVDYCYVTLIPAPILVESIELEDQALILRKGEKLQFVARILPEDATNQTVTWSSSDEKVVTVDETGFVTAVDFGNATITVVTEDGGKTASCDITVNAKGDLALRMVDIPAGVFMMGKNTGTNLSQGEVVHQVTLTQGFKMSKYEITNKQFCFFLNDKQVGADGMYNGKLMVTSSEGTSYDWGVHYNGTEWEPAPDKANFPVIYVTWYGASEFAAYAGGALPTEAQWEYACRGGLDGTPFGLGTGMDLNKTLANFTWTTYVENGAMKMDISAGASLNTMEVNSYGPNAYGLYNMHGNVREWCRDWFALEMSTDDVEDPVGPETGEYRMIRGGAWRAHVICCGCTFRNISLPAVQGVPTPDRGDERTGFRIVMPL